MNDPWADAMRRILDTVRSGPGVLPVGLREAIMTGASVPEPLASYVVEVQTNPQLVGDDDIRALLGAGYTEDQIFEATVSAALAAGAVRLRAGLTAVQESNDAT